MDDYISREAAVNFAKHAYNEWNLAMAAADGQRQINLVYKRQELCKAVESVFHDVPAAEVAAVVHSKWENVYDDFSTAECVACKSQFEVTFEGESNKALWNGFCQSYRYCPHCGARMDGEQDAAD